MGLKHLLIPEKYQNQAPWELAQRGLLLIDKINEVRTEEDQLIQGAS
jgi:hypothetical protein